MRVPYVGAVEGCALFCAFILLPPSGPPDGPLGSQPGPSVGLSVSRQGIGLQLFIFPGGLLFSSCLLKASLFAFPCPLRTGVGLLGQPRGHQTAFRCLPRHLPLLFFVLPRALRLPSGASQSSRCAVWCGPEPSACLSVPSPSPLLQTEW